MNLVKTISSEANSLKQLLVKVLRYGKSDVQTPIQALAYGLDSNPIKDMVAVYSKTDSDSDALIIGYLNKNSLAESGEYRTYCTDDNGVEKFYTWMKKNGTIEIGGDTNYAVKFNELKEEFNKLKQSHNDLLTEYKLHVHILSVPAITAAPTVSTQSPNTSNIDLSKNDKIKTIG